MANASRTPTGIPLVYRLDGVASHAELRPQRVGDRAGRAGPRDAVDDHVDALVPERHEAGQRRRVGQRLLVGPTELAPFAPARVQRPVPRMPLVRAVRPPRAGPQL